MPGNQRSSERARYCAKLTRLALNDAYYYYYTGMADFSDTSRWWFNCVSVCESVCPWTCRSPYCSAHDELLIMKTLHVQYVGYHDANNVSNFGGDPFKFKNV